jgi:hypothetical protein
VVTDYGKLHRSVVYGISERVHDHVVVSLTATYPLL